ncbi:ssDNA endonuclease and repair protein rad10 [Modicella reniformis]|uniref:DNA excision repair protein ERCC-1 n=1 Tax=Modicella reniformis TaxID=1440133 RepID=A0A9P6MM31_9FUNG|nr:ssDNA endonuclease and repair protein rad10 [Modicella reniformis]
MNQHPSNNNGTAEPKKQFRLPTREEAEERQRQIEANSKPMFKPKGIDTSSPLNATKSGTTSLANYANAIINDANSANKSRSNSSNSTTRDTAGKPISTPMIFDFGDDLGDDLGDVALDNDLFDIDDNDLGKAQGQVGASISSSAPAPGTAATIGAPVAPPPFVPKSKTTIVVNSSQRVNPLLQFIRNVPYEYGDIVPDFVVGLTSCVLFLSIRYHLLHPEYIFNRIAALGKTYVLRVLLVLVDKDTHQQVIRELTRVAILNDFTIVCAWSNEEAARYIETYKAYENKAPDAIKERVDNDYLSKLTDCLTQIQAVNKTDVITLASTFGSFKSIMNASVDELGVLPGFGERKVKRLLEAFDQPFAIDPKKRRRRRL